MEQQELITWAYIVIAAIGVIGFTYILQLAVRMLGNSVPQSAIEGIMNRVIDAALAEAKRMTDATPNKVDDGFVNALIERQKANAAPQPTLPAPTQPTVTVSDAPTVTISTPPFSPVPEIPREEIKYLHPYETRLDFGSRQVHVPVNMAYVFENKNGAGQDYPHPNVNVNAAYGARFDIAFIAGSWGLTYLTTLAKNVQYKVIVDYSAEVTGKHLDTLPEWLWWELEVSTNGKPGLKTGVNQAIMNGAAHTAEWGITGTGEPVFLTPRIRALWASALDNSAINWHSLRVVPVVHQAEAAIVAG